MTRMGRQGFKQVVLQGAITAGASLVGVLALMVWERANYGMFQLAVIFALNIVMAVLLWRAYATSSFPMALAGVGLGLAWSLAVAGFLLYRVFTAEVRHTAFGTIDDRPAPSVLAGACYLVAWYVVIAARLVIHRPGKPE
ncbi:MAG: hypothetical protein NT080_01310 [Spirochaetes bacterium]|nr:hypothetical protein [Spirochaetota bacterium]